MKKIAIFTDDPGWHGRQLQQAFLRRGYQASYVSLTQCQLVLASGFIPVLIPGFDGCLPEAVFVRGVPGGSLEEVIFYLDILHALKMLGVPVYNDAQAIERSVDKGMTSFLLQRSGIPTPETWQVRDREVALEILEQQLSLGHLMMTKPVFGSQGEGIRRIEKMADLLWLTSSRGIYYLQRFVHCSGDGFSDIRVFVIKGWVVAAMKRRGRSWLNNVAQGATCEAVVPDPKLEELALAAVQAIGMDYAGVDVIQDKNGDYLVIEVNSIPAWKGLQSVCELNIAQLLVDNLLERLPLTNNEVADVAL